MTEHTKEQIAAAARLVPEHAAFFHYSDGEVAIVRKGSMILWQPWAETEAGRSDALALYIAVRNWIAQNQHTSEIYTALFDLECVRDGYEVGTPGEIVRMLQTATFAAAIAIGEHMGVSDDK